MTLNEEKAPSLGFPTWEMGTIKAPLSVGVTGGRDEIAQQKHPELIQIGGRPSVSSLPCGGVNGAGRVHEAEESGPHTAHEAGPLDSQLCVFCISGSRVLDGSQASALLPLGGHCD